MGSTGLLPNLAGSHVGHWGRTISQACRVMSCPTLSHDNLCKNLTFSDYWLFGVYLGTRPKSNFKTALSLTETNKYLMSVTMDTGPEGLSTILKYTVCTYGVSTQEAFQPCFSVNGMTEQINFYFKQSSCLHRPVAAHLLHTKCIFGLQVYFLVYYALNYSDCLLGSEHCQNAHDLHSLLCLNTSCVDTDGALKLLLLC